ncbi:MAG: hypothetical protein AAGF99_13010 [Bacteroidota bacterium]
MERLRDALLRWWPAYIQARHVAAWRRDDTARMLAFAAQSSRCRVRMLALRGLASARGPDVLPALRRVLRDRSALLALTAAELLRQRHPDEALLREIERVEAHWRQVASERDERWRTSGVERGWFDKDDLVRLQELKATLRRQGANSSMLWG